MNNTHAICQLAVCPLRADATDQSEIVSQLLFGEFVTVLSLNKPWAKVRNETDGYEGWMDFKQLKFIDEKSFLKAAKTSHLTVGNPQLVLTGPHGDLTVFMGAKLPFYDSEKCWIGDDVYLLKSKLFQASNKNIDLLCQAFINAPYLWGGKSLFGIDCSGLTQVIFGAIGINVPRDASQQVSYGTDIEWEDRQKYDIVFFTTSTEKVTHVGILLSKTEIIHAHGRVRIDNCDEKGIYNREQDKYTHMYHSLKRWE